MPPRSAFTRPTSVVAATIVVLVAIAAFGVRRAPDASPAAASTSATSPAPSTRVAPQPVLVAGPADAPVVIEAYTDFQCPFCGQQERAHGAAVRALVAGPTASARLVVYDVALPDHPYALDASRLVRCAGDESARGRAFDAVFAAQATWTTAPDAATARTRLEQAAAAGASDSAVFRACAARAEDSLRARLDANLQQAIARGVTGTPTYVIRRAHPAPGVQDVRLDGETMPDAIAAAVRRLAP